MKDYTNSPTPHFISNYVGARPHYVYFLFICGLFSNALCSTDVDDLIRRYHCIELFICIVHKSIKLVLLLNVAMKINLCCVEIQFPLRHFVCSKSYKMTNKNEI